MGNYYENINVNIFSSPTSSNGVSRKYFFRTTCIVILSAGLNLQPHRIVQLQNGCCIVLLIGEESIATNVKCLHNIEQFLMKLQC